MSTLTVFRREWIGRRNALLVAVGEGLLLLLAAWVDPTLRPPHDRGLLMAVFGSLIFVWVFAALFGATMIGKDLEERRFGFFLNRPLHPAQIFFGKVAAGLVFAALAGVLVGLPWTLVTGAWRQLPWVEVARLVGFWFGGGLLLLLTLHVLSIQTRARTPWILLDIAVWGGLLWGWWRLAVRLLLARTTVSPEWFLGGTFGLLILGLLVAGYLQVAEGRADLRRGHRWVSLTMATTVAIILLAGWGFSSWAIATGAEAAGAVGGLSPRKLR
jgi:hypothetical protein